MEKRVLLLKSFLQTCYFSIHLQKPYAVLIALISSISFFINMISGPNGHLHSAGIGWTFLSFVSLGLAIVIHQPSINNRMFWWSLFGALISALNIAYYPDDYAVITYFVTHFMVIGTLHSGNFKNIFTGLLQYIILQFSSIVYFFAFLLDENLWQTNKKNKKHKHLVKLISIPLLVTTIFISIYSLASGAFAQMISQPILNFLEYLTQSVNEMTVVLFIMGSFFLVPLLTPVVLKSLLIKPMKYLKITQRKRQKATFAFGTLALKNELKIAIISLSSLNILVLIFNVLDIKNVWINHTLRTPAELSQFVHQGTNLTLFSIALGISILVFFYRRNLNFLSRTGLLKQLSFIWLAQNAFLALSTFMRNFRYVQEYGLTEKRLGVIIFVMLCLISLFLTYQKINYKFSIPHFFNKISLAFYLIILGFTLLNHQGIIIRHAAIIQKSNVDIAYINGIGRNHLKLLKKYKPILDAKASSSIDQINYQDRYIYKFDNWREWNFVDYRNAAFYHHEAN